MKTINLEKEVFEKLIKEDQVSFLSNDKSIKVLDHFTCSYKNDTCLVKVINIKKFKDIDDLLNSVNYQILGNFKSKEEVRKTYQENNNNIILCKLKKESNEKIALPKEVLKYLDNDTYEEIKVGFSNTKVLKVKMKDTSFGILKISFNPLDKSLKNEYEKIKWLQGKINCPKIYLFKETNKYSYLLMEYLEGINSYKVKGISKRLGEELRKIHNLDINNCPFTDMRPEILLEKALKNIDKALTEILSIYPEENKESIMKFLRENMPNDHVFCHGDYSMPNILINKEKINFIDLGEAGISTKYLDIFYAVKSLKMNKFTDEIDSFIKGYGLEKLNENYMKWMNIVDKILF